MKSCIFCLLLTVLFSGCQIISTETGDVSVQIPVLPGKASLSGQELARAYRMSRYIRIIKDRKIKMKLKANLLIDDNLQYDSNFIKLINSLGISAMDFSDPLDNLHQEISAKAVASPSLLFGNKIISVFCFYCQKKGSQIQVANWLTKEIIFRGNMIQLIKNRELFARKLNQSLLQAAFFLENDKPVFNKVDYQIYLREKKSHCAKSIKTLQQIQKANCCLCIHYISRDFGRGSVTLSLHKIKPGQIFQVNGIVTRVVLNFDKPFKVTKFPDDYKDSSGNMYIAFGNRSKNTVQWLNCLPIVKLGKDDKIQPICLDLSKYGFGKLEIVQHSLPGWIVKKNGVEFFVFTRDTVFVKGWQDSVIKGIKQIEKIFTLAPGQVIVYGDEKYSAYYLKNTPHAIYLGVSVLRKNNGMPLAEQMETIRMTTVHESIHFVDEILKISAHSEFSSWHRQIAADSFDFFEKINEGNFLSAYIKCKLFKAGHAQGSPSELLATVFNSLNRKGELPKNFTPADSQILQKTYKILDKITAKKFVAKAREVFK
jgi:hypothetical protein